MAGELVLEKVRLEVADGVATLTLNDPGALNVTGYRMGADLRAATEYIADMAGVRAILLNAEGKHFCGGGDLRAMQATFGQDPTAFFTQALVDIHHAVVNLHSAPIPVVAAVQGFAAGAGANLPLAADIVLAADDAQFFQAFVQVGLAVDSGGAWFLPRAIGDKRALYYLMTGAKMNAAEAYNLGLVSRVVPGESLQQEARALAVQLANGPTQAYAQIKNLVRHHHHFDLPAHLDEELAAQIALGSTKDFQTGVNGFLAKERPQFEGQ